MKKDEKKRRRDTVENLKDLERTKYKASLPASESDIKTLFDYLDKQLEECDDTLRLTNEFIKERNLPVVEIVSWLNEHGGFCDCEVLANVEDEYNQMFGEA